MIGQTGKIDTKPTVGLTAKTNESTSPTAVAIIGDTKSNGKPSTKKRRRAFAILSSSSSSSGSVDGSEEQEF